MPRPLKSQGETMPFLNHGTHTNTIGRILIFWFKITDLIGWEEYSAVQTLPVGCLSAHVFFLHVW